MTRSSAMTLGIAASIGAGVVHFALGPEHLEELGALGVGFFLAAALQLGWAAVMIVANSEARVRKVGTVGIGINVAILAAWLVSRTVGLPAGETPWVAESIGPVDLITAGLEVAVIAAIAFQLRARATSTMRRPGMATALAVLAIAVGTATALVLGMSPSGSHEPSHGQSHEAMAGPDSAP